MTDGEPKGWVRWSLRAWLYAEAVGAVLAVVIGLFYLKPWVASLPDEYHLSVQVLDPSGLPVQDATVKVSVGNEPQLLADGWWEVEIPRAQVPVDGLVTVWAEHAQWQGGRADILLGKDPNPHVEVRLQEPEERIGGVVVGRDGRGVVGARISGRNIEAESAVTNSDGRLGLLVKAAPPEPTEGKVFTVQDLPVREVECRGPGHRGRRQSPVQPGRRN